MSNVSVEFETRDFSIDFTLAGQDAMSPEKQLARDIKLVNDAAETVIAMLKTQAEKSQYLGGNV